MTKPAKSPVSNIHLNFATKPLKLAERIGVAARELSLYESQLYAWRLHRHQPGSPSSG